MQVHACPDVLSSNESMKSRITISNVEVYCDKIFLSIDCYISTTIKFISLLHTNRLYTESCSAMTSQWGIPSPSIVPAMKDENKLIEQQENQ